MSDHQPQDLQAQPERLEQFNRFVLDDLALRDPVDIGAIVSAGYVLDFLILYESLLETWTFYPFRLHAFATDDEAHEALAGLQIPDVEVHLMPGESKGFDANAMRQMELIEHSGLDRCLVSDVDNVFLAETPELFLLLNEADLVFVGGPPPAWLIMPNLWAFRRNDLTREFAQAWMEQSEGRSFHDASGLPFVLMDPPNPNLRIKVLARPKPEQNPDHHPSPYDVQANIRPFYLAKDPHGLGFREPQMGRAKVVHLGSLRGEGRESVSERLRVLVRRFPGTHQFLPFYATLATRAARRLGMDDEGTPLELLRMRLEERRYVPTRSDFPKLFNDRTLAGQGLLVDVSDKAFTNAMDDWKGTLVDASPAEIAEGSLDFAYLDGPRDYESVKADLERWFGKVRVGGILAGSCFVDGDFAEGRFGVRSAVNEFFEAQNLRVRTTVLDAPWVSWYVEIGGPPFRWTPPAAS